MHAIQYAVIGRPFPFEAVGAVLRDCGDEWRAYLAEELLTGSEGGGVRVGGGVEGFDAFEEAGVVGVEVGEVEELGGVGFWLLVCDLVGRGWVVGVYIPRFGLWTAARQCQWWW